MVAAVDHDAPFQVNPCPPLSTAIQKDEVTHETAVRLNAPLRTVLVHELPVHSEAAVNTPPPPTAQQSEEETQDTADPSAPFTGVAHDDPFHLRPSPLPSTAMQNVDERHETAFTGVTGSLPTGADHDAPFQVRALPVAVDSRTERRGRT